MSSNPLEQNQFEELVANLSHENYRVRYKAARTLGDIGDVRAIEPLLEALGDFDTKDEESKVNRSAVRALNDIGEAAFVPLIKALVKNVQHPNDGWRRYWVAQTLRFRRDKRAVEPLIQVLEDDDWEAIEGTVEALGDLGDKQGIEPLIKTLARLKRQRKGGYVLMAVSEAIQRLGGEIKLEITEQEEQVAQGYNKSRKTKGIYLYGPWKLSQPTSREILEVLFGASEVVAVELKATRFSLDTTKRMFSDKYRLFSHPWGGFEPKYIEAVGFPPALEIIGIGVAFNWFYYQYYKEYSDILKIHLEIALSDKSPVVVLIDTALPIRQRTGDSSLTTKIGTDFEEISDLYRPPGEAEIESFAKRYGLNDHNIITFDLTEPQSLIEAMTRTVKLFEHAITHL